MRFQTFKFTNIVLLFLGLFILSFLKVQAQDILKTATWNVEHFDYFKLMGESVLYGNDCDNFISEAIPNEKAGKGTAMSSVIKDIILKEKIDILFLQEIEPLTWIREHDVVSHLSDFECELSFEKYKYKQVCYFHYRKDTVEVKDKMRNEDIFYLRNNVSYLGECYGVIYDSTKITAVEVSSVLNDTIFNKKFNTPILLNDSNEALSKIDMGFPRPPLQMKFELVCSDSALSKNIYSYHANLDYPKLDYRRIKRTIYENWKGVSKKTSLQIDSITSYINQGIILGDFNNTLNNDSINLHGYTSINNNGSTFCWLSDSASKSYDKILIKDIDKNYLLDSGVIKKYEGVNINVASCNVYNFLKGKNSLNNECISDHAIKWISFKYGGNLTLTKDQNNNITDTLFFVNRGLKLGLPGDSLYLLGRDFLEKEDTLSVVVYPENNSGQALFSVKVPISAEGNVNQFVFNAQAISDSSKQEGDTTMAYNLVVKLHEWTKVFPIHIKTYNPATIVTIKSVQSNVADTLFEGNSGLWKKILGDTLFFRGDNFTGDKDTVYLTLQKGSIAQYINYENKPIVFTRDTVFPICPVQALADSLKQEDNSNQEYQLIVRQENIADTLYFNIQTYDTAFIALNNEQKQCKRDTFLVETNDSLWIWGKGFPPKGDSLILKYDTITGENRIPDWENRIVEVQDTGFIDYNLLGTAESIADTNHQNEDTNLLYKLLVNQHDFTDTLKFYIKTETPKIQLQNGVNSDDQIDVVNPDILQDGLEEETTIYSFVGLKGLKLEEESDSIYIKGEGFQKKQSKIAVEIFPEGCSIQKEHIQDSATINKQGELELIFFETAQYIVEYYNQEEDTKQTYYLATKKVNWSDTIELEIQRNIKPKVNTANSENDTANQNLFVNRRGDKCEQSGDNVYYNGHNFPEATNDDLLSVDMYQKDGEQWQSMPFSSSVKISNEKISAKMGTAEQILGDNIFGLYKITAHIKNDSIEEEMFTITRCQPQKESDPTISIPVNFPTTSLIQKVSDFLKEHQFNKNTIRGTKNIGKSGVSEGLFRAGLELAKDGIMVAFGGEACATVSTAGAFVTFLIPVPIIGAAVLETNKTKYNYEYDHINNDYYVIQGNLGNVYSLLNDYKQDSSNEMVFIGSTDSTFNVYAENSNVKEKVIKKIDSINQSIMPESIQIKDVFINNHQYNFVTDSLSADESLIMEIMHEGERLNIQNDIQFQNNTISIPISKLDTLSTYNVRVRIENNFGKSEWSSYVLLPKPQFDSVYLHKDSLFVSWNANTDITSCIVWLEGNDSVTVNSSNIVFSNVQPVNLHAYPLKVKLYLNDTTFSVWSNTTYAIAAPALKSFKLNSDQLSVNWEAANKAVGYFAELSDASGTVIFRKHVIQSTNFTINISGLNLSPSKWYRCRVQGMRENTTGQWSTYDSIIINRLIPGMKFKQGNRLYSSDSTTILTIDENGSLYLNYNNRPVWDLQAFSYNPCDIAVEKYCRIQENGALVIPLCDDDSIVTSYTSTEGNTAAYLEVSHSYMATIKDNKELIWQSNVPFESTWNGKSNILSSGKCLFRGDTIYSPDRSTTLTLTSLGNLELSVDNKNVWESGTAHPTGTELSYQIPKYIVMQSDGNLVIPFYDWKASSTWTTKTSGNPGAYLEVFKGYMVIKSANELTNESIIWSSNMPFSSIPDTLSSVLFPGQALLKEDYITSEDGSTKLIMQKNGNLELYYNQQSVWSSNTAGKDPGIGKYFIMKGDGSLVIPLEDYVEKFKLWSIHIGDETAYLEVLNGYMVVKSMNDKIIWNSKDN